MKFHTSVTQNEDCKIVRIYSSEDLFVNDGSTPEPDLGYLCFRENHKWLVSGIINESIVKNEGSLNDLVYEIAADSLNLDDCLSLNVSVIKVVKTLCADGESDDTYV